MESAASDGDGDDVHAIAYGIVDGLEYGGARAPVVADLVHGHAARRRTALGRAPGEPMVAPSNTAAPAAVDAVCVPWPTVSRGEPSVAAAPEREAFFDAVDAEDSLLCWVTSYYRAPISFLS